MGEEQTKKTSNWLLDGQWGPIEPYNNYLS